MTSSLIIGLLLVVTITACSGRMDLPLEYPTPPPAAQATPAQPLTITIDFELEKQIGDISVDARGEVGAAALLLETGDGAFFNADERFPMQSVYKLPIAMAVLEEVKRGRFDLDEKIGVTREDMVRKGMRSPLRDQNPDGGEFTVRELVRLSIVESDGTASDVLMKMLGETSETQAFLTRIGIFEIKVVDPEKEIGRDWNVQYRNYATPAASVDLLRWLQVAADTAGADEADESPWSVLIKFMAESNPGERRLKGLLPKGAVVAHKTGTSGTQNGLTAASNDVGIITLPNGKHAAVAVFVSDSKGDEKTREAVIARIAQAVWDRWGS